ncbi:putative porin [Bacteroidota bacterium]
MLFCAAGGLKGQLLDDSTQLVYGPATTNYTYLSEIKTNRIKSYNPDTSVSNLHAWTHVNLHANRIQDLGNIGTSGMDVFHEEPYTIGRTSGFNSFKYYFLNTSNIKLYNTRSPFTHLYSVFGGGQRNVVEVTHSQNIKPNWNFGANYRRLSINKQISSTGRGDNEVVSTAYNGYSYYWTEDSSYLVFGAFSRLNHQLFESGGIVHNDSSTIKDYFSDNIEVYLENANSKEFQLSYHVYQQFKWKELFSIYNDTRRSVMRNSFTDTNLGGEKEFFDHFILDEAETHDQSKFQEFSSEFGAKGDWKKAYYNMYYKIRRVNFLHKYLQLEDYRTESYIGGSLRYDNDTSYQLLLSGELMSNGNHRFYANYENKLWDLSYLRYMYEPAAMYENYFSNHYQWHNDFIPTQTDKIRASIKVPLKRIYLEPGTDFSLVKNYIYFNREKQPEQASGFSQIISPRLYLGLQLSDYISWKTLAIYTLTTGDDEARDAFRIPPVFVNSRLAYEKLMFDGKLYFSVGIDAHYKSVYFAKAYDPITQQFYLQDNFKIPEYLLLDLFVNIRINTMRIFVKYAYLNEKKAYGYFITPHYPGQPKVIDLGVSWKFYD